MRTITGQLPGDRNGRKPGAVASHPQRLPEGPWKLAVLMAAVVARLHWGHFLSGQGLTRRLALMVGLVLLVDLGIFLVAIHFGNATVVQCSTQC